MNSKKKTDTALYKTIFTTLLERILNFLVKILVLLLQDQSKIVLEIEQDLFENFIGTCGQIFSSLTKTIAGSCQDLVSTLDRIIEHLILFYLSKILLDLAKTSM